MAEVVGEGSGEGWDMKFLFKHLKGKEASRMYSIAAVSIFTGLAAAFIDTVWALYIDSFVHSAFLVGLISALLSLIAFVSYFFIIPLIEKKDKVKLYSFSLLTFVLAYLIFSISSNLITLLIVSLPLAFFGSLRTTSFGIIVRDFSSVRNLSKNEGMLYSVENVSWVMGPLIAGYILSSFGFSLVFVISALGILASFFILKFSSFRDLEVKKRIDGNVLKNFFDFFKSRDRVLAYVFSGGVSVWWTLIYIFVPVYVVESGYSEILVGYFLFVVAIPLVFAEYYFGEVAARRGFRKLFRFGYLLVAVVSLFAFFFSNIYVILGILVLASFGMSMLESTTEAYFFDILDRKQHLRFYGPFNTADSLLSLIAKLGASAVLFFLPFRYLFVFFAVFMGIYFVLSFFMKDSIECRRGLADCC